MASNDPVVSPWRPTAICEPDQARRFPEPCLSLGVMLSRAAAITKLSLVPPTPRSSFSRAMRPRSSASRPASRRRLNSLRCRRAPTRCSSTRRSKPTTATAAGRTTSCCPRQARQDALPIAGYAHGLVDRQRSVGHRLRVDELLRFARPLPRQPADGLPIRPAVPSQDDRADDLRTIQRGHAGYHDHLGVKRRPTDVRPAEPRRNLGLRVG